MASTTEDVLRRHVKCFFDGDLDGIVWDYSADAVLFTPNGPHSQRATVGKPTFAHDSRERRQSPSANTHTAPPSGTSGNSPGRMALSRPCIPRASMPHPDCTATY